MKLYKRYKYPTTLHFDNAGKYGTTFVECQIIYTNGCFRVYLTDGYDFLNAGECFDNLKDAVKFGQSKIVA